MINVVVLVSGGGTNLQALIDSVEAGNIKGANIAAVISNKKDAYALTRAAEHGIKGECISPKDYSSREEFASALVSALDRYEADLVVLAGYLVIVPKAVIRAYAGKIINIHPSLIPSHCGPGYYGLHVHESVLARGNKVTGATVHFVDEGTDTGPIILQKAVEVMDDDTPQTLQRRVMEEAEWVILPKAVDMIANDEIIINDNNIVVRK
ncbi:MAG: phosphoribosylglycinamide formyltransferase [Lachnospiraceae bacterium]|nr:phosphoribosylglycinamide formyltransferase [Lachnospiraceae bacterium]